MTDRALSEEAMRASLRDITLPPDAAGGWLSDLAMTIGLAGLAALLLALGLRLISQRSKSPRPQTVADRLAAVRELPPEDRRIALLHLLRTVAPDRYANVAQDLYRPGSTLDPDLLEAEVARFA